MKEAEKLEETETLEEAERLKEKLEEKPEKKVTEKEKHKEKKERIRKGKLRDQVSSSSTCPHEFGYLGTLPKSASIPDECLGCPEIIECLAQK